MNGGRNNLFLPPLFNVANFFHHGHKKKYHAHQILKNLNENNVITHFMTKTLLQFTTLAAYNRNFQFLNQSK